MTAAATQASAVRANLALLSAPDAQDFTLTGKGPSADALGRVFMGKSHGLLFSASKLPQIAEAQTYQLWLLTKAAPVSAGVVRPDADGNITAAFDMPADAAAPAGFALSIGPDGGSTAPTGALYLSTR
ncbi:MAG: anti-sigma factor [Vicinamibacterales bacterium]